MAENELEIYRQSRQQQDKYTYFLLAAAGACIAFALNQTKGQALQPSHWPLGFAVLSWGASFFMGCRRLHAFEAVLHLNHQLIRVQKGTHELLEHRAEIPIAAEAFRKRLDAANDHVGSRARWQFRLLIVGAVAYIGWHTWEMYLRAAELAAA